MPARISRNSVQSNKSSQSSHKNDRKRKQRSFDAFSIASKQAPEKNKVRQHRLGEVEVDDSRRKRQKLAVDEEGGSDEERSKKARVKDQKSVAKGRFDELDISEGSDSDGNEWRLGHVDEDDDSDLDSDEAFGESDEERFEGFTFGGSSSSQRKSLKGNYHAKKGAIKDSISLEEEEDTVGGDDGLEDDLGDAAIDLAQMLDDNNESDFTQDEEVEQDSIKKIHYDDHDVLKNFKNLRNGVDFQKTSSRSAHAFGDGDEDLSPSDHEPVTDVEDEGGSGIEYEGSSSDSDSGSEDEDEDEDEDNERKLRQLQDVVASLPKAEAQDDRDESQHGPVESGFDKNRLLSALKSMSNLDPALSKSMKKLSRTTDESKSQEKDGTVKVPLPKRQQDRIDRAVAYDKAKETLNRWIETVKHNRRAEHLSFPLRDPNAQEAPGTSRLLPTTNDKPQNELESVIQNILTSSGLATSKNQDDIEIKNEEELQSKHMSLEEATERRAELRKARELLFREEIRAKRINKIKSKSYRRVHRKEKGKAAERERDLLAAHGLIDSEEEREHNDRRRATERMGARHRESRWAKSIKQTGRSAWDEDARLGVADLARRNEELKKRMDGKRVQNSEHSGSDFMNDDSESDSDDDSGNEFKLREDLAKVNGDEAPVAKKGLASMKFMQRAEAAQKKQNDETVEALRRELNGEESIEVSSPEPEIGRMIFGAAPKAADKQASAVPKNDLEEGFSSDEEMMSKSNRGNDVNEINRNPRADNDTQISKISKKPTVSLQSNISSRTGVKSDKKNQFHQDSATGSKKQPKGTAEITGIESTGPRTTSKTPSTTAANNDSVEDEAENPMVASYSELVRAAFGGDDTEIEFQKEKHDAVEDEGDKIIDNTLPGWGSWAGEGLSKRDKNRELQKRKSGKFVTKEEGVKAANRKDAKLDKIIISEKRVKKNGKYLASSLPHTFENRHHYERSLRIPIGPEWTTKESFQTATKPRVMVKQGIIGPMRTPML